MNLEGYKILQHALDNAVETMGADISPVPEPGEDVRDVEISRRGLNQRALTQVLREAGLMRLSPEPHISNNAPNFAWNGSEISLQSRNRIVYKLTDTKAP